MVAPEDGPVTQSCRRHTLVIDPGNWPGAAEFTTEPQADGQILLVSYLAQND
jgi:hypothetical protein